METRCPSIPHPIPRPASLTLLLSPGFAAGSRRGIQQNGQTLLLSPGFAGEMSRYETEGANNEHRPTSLRSASSIQPSRREDRMFYRLAPLAIL